MQHLYILVMALLTACLAGCDDEGGDGDGDVDVDTDTDVDVDSDADTDADDGDVEPPPPCEETIGGGTISGSVGGEELTAAHTRATWIEVQRVAGYSVAFVESSGTCEEVATSVPALTVFACDDLAGSYVVGETCSESGLTFPNSIRLPRPEGTVEATEGTITIEAFEPDCGGEVRGSFTADFDGEAVTGTFETISCGPASL